MALSDNWYLALELPFDPVPEEDPTVIDARITEKVKFWSTNATDPSKGGLYTMWREKADQMRSDLADPATRRRLADEAIAETYGKLDSVLAQASNKGARAITPTQLERLAKLAKVPVDVARRRAKATNIEVGEEQAEDPRVFQALFDEHYTRKPDKYLLFEGYKADLVTAGAADLYAFLGKAAPSAREGFPEGQDAEALPTATLSDIGKELRLAFNRKIDTSEKIKGTVGKYCEITFADEAARRQYDTYLRYVARRGYIDSVVENIRVVHDGRCKRAVGDEYILHLSRFFEDRTTAAQFFVALCRVKGFEFDVDEAESGASQDRESCRCGAINDVSDGAKNCTRCGRPLRQVCPRCRRESSNVHNFCPCGFDFLNVVRAATACGLARAALAGFDLERAKDDLALAITLYPEHSEIAPVAEAIKRLERSIGNQLSEITRQVADLNFSRARRLLDDLQRSYPAFANPSLTAHVDSQLRAANLKLDQARRESSTDAVLRLCKEVYSICRDLPELKELASRHTDLPLDALSVNDTSASNVSVAQVNHKIVVRMDTPGAGETAILVAYRFDSYPEGPHDPLAITREFQVVELTQEGVLRLEPAQKRTYYVAVFLTFEASGRQFFSRGEYAKLDLASKVVLTYSLSKRLFSSKLSLALASDGPLDLVPEIAVVYSVGHAPVFEESAQHVTTIPSQGVRFPCTFTVDLPSLPKNVYVKPFSHDPLFQLRLATNSSNKIS